MFTCIYQSIEGKLVLNSPLPVQPAKQYSLELQNRLDTHGFLDYDGDKLYPPNYLFGAANGQMLGVLVCTDADGNEVVLKAFSGQYHGQWLIPGWVPPVCDTEKFNALVKKTDDQIHELTEMLSTAEVEDAAAMQEKRKALSQHCLKQIYDLYTFRCIDGHDISLSDLFGSKLPPTGTGDCCAPKLLQYAFTHQLHPVSMAEFYYGAPNSSGTKQHKEFYGPCDERCKPLLKHILGLEIVYCDETIIVVNKESGMLSVPGRVVFDCVEAQVKHLFPDTIKQPAVHRLDMDTSGLIVMALSREAHRNLSIQFIQKLVHKQYVALLEGVIKGHSGTIELPFRLDVENRPYQIYDPEQGKMGKTHWEKVGVEYFRKDRLATRIHFTPVTGRTHQLRLHSAHEKGLGHPIIGDRLYGREESGQRMLLHACKISFSHPKTQKSLTFISEAEF